MKCKNTPVKLTEFTVRWNLPEITVYTGVENWILPYQMYNYNCTRESIVVH